MSKFSWRSSPLRSLIRRDTSSPKGQPHVHPSQMNELNLDGWRIALENLPPGFDRSRLYSPCDFVFECPNADVASLIYSVDELRMGWLVGSFAIVQQKAHPSVVFSSQRFRCFSTRDTVYYSRNGHLVFAKTYWYLLNSEKNAVLAVDIPLTVFDVASHRFACIVFKNSLPYKMRELSETIFQLVEVNGDEQVVSQDGCFISLEKVEWHNFTDIENYHEIYHVQRGS